MLAGGTKRMAQKYGRPIGEAVQTKGLEFPMHDPRAYHSMGLVYATAPRGADHNKSDGYQVDGGTGHPDLGLEMTDRWADDKAEMVEKARTGRAVTDSMGICHFAQVPVSLSGRYDQCLHRLEYGHGPIAEGRERVFQLQRALSCKLGITAKDDVLPELIYETDSRRRAGGPCAQYGKNAA